MKKFFFCFVIGFLQFNFCESFDSEREFINSLPEGNVRVMCNECPVGVPLKNHLKRRLDEDFDTLLSEDRDQLLQVILDLQASTQQNDVDRIPSQEIVAKFKEIHVHLSNIPQQSNVHVLDAYVFGPQGKITDLLEIGNFYGLDDPSLSLLQVGQQMSQFVQENSYLFEGYAYEGTAQIPPQITAIIQSHFNNMDAEVSGICPKAREIWSRAWTMATILYQANGDFYPLKCIFDQVCEGHLTNGGCIQGRIDRGFVGYVMLLGRAGLGSYL